MEGASGRFEETGEGFQGGGGDVVFDAFGVIFRIFTRDADGEEEVHDEAVAGADAVREGLAGFGEEDAAIGQGGGEAFAFEAGDCFDDGDVADAEAAGDVRGAGFAAGGEEVRDELGIILDEGGSAGFARVAEAAGLGGFG